MMNDERTIKELQSYARKILLSLVMISVLGLILIGASQFFGKKFFVELLYGALTGAFLATINIFAIGYAFFQIALKKESRSALIWPCASFFTMCLLAYLLVTSFSQFIFGFALGLTVPVLFGAVVIFGKTKPA